MRGIVSLMLLAPAIVFAVSPQSVTVLPAEGKVLPLEGKVLPSSPQSGSGPSREARFTIGAVDTVGGTTYDWGATGSALRMLTQTPDKGVHALFMRSPDMDTNFLTRNMRYNFYDYSLGVWNWYDPNFMEAGLDVFSMRTGYGRIDVDTNGVAVVSAHHATSTLAPIVARDVEAGAGLFEYSNGEPTFDNYAWPWIAVNMNGAYQLAMIEYVNKENLFWGRSTSWETWDPAVSIPSPQPEPRHNAQNIATSKVPGSNKVCITWVGTTPGVWQQNPGFYRESPDGGDNWDPPVDLGYPLTFHPGSDTLPYWHIAGLFPLYDRNDDLHIVGTVAPYVGDTCWPLPAEIWHWCASNPETWNLIHAASPDTGVWNIGYNAAVCCRPSLGQDDRGNLFVAWEEFDSLNVEPTTSRNRADIWYSYSTDNGVTWAEGMKITDGGEVTYRFPSILDPIGDTVMVEYMIDQVAGFFLYAEGEATHNPIVVQKWANPVGIAGPKVAPPGRMEVAVGPNPFGRSTRLSYAVPHRGNVSLAIFDALGRNVRTLVCGQSEPGRFSATWDGRSQSGALVPEGVYLYRYALDDKRMTGKLTLTR
jgi:hypothetical protein